MKLFLMKKSNKPCGTKKIKDGQTRASGGYGLVAIYRSMAIWN